ncbi:unnamed protein product [Chondrus crispus]|uniref:Uncharacterized protein n=1 Tax=Chondrus crispus TaxID=2769 RepID=R7Q2K2_CHOCR|nr:unnamed protein product [Chondrus crispus]CDF32812.1 unnamed protein product [Chondrus crispus]|eukprot:XP_005712613.1 unnamed protein product [Chondrus crispus]
MGAPDVSRYVGPPSFNSFGRNARANIKENAEAGKKYCLSVVEHSCSDACKAFCPWDFVGWSSSDLMFCGTISDPFPKGGGVRIRGRGLYYYNSGVAVSVKRVSDLSVNPWSRARRGWRWRAARATRAAGQFVSLVASGRVRLVGSNEASERDEGPVDVIFDQPLPHLPGWPVPAGCCVVDVRGVEWWQDCRTPLSGGCPAVSIIQTHLYPCGLEPVASGQRAQGLAATAEYGENFLGLPVEQCVKLGEVGSATLLAREADLSYLRAVVVKRGRHDVESDVSSKAGQELIACESDKVLAFTHLDVFWEESVKRVLPRSFTAAALPDAASETDPVLRVCGSTLHEIIDYCLPGERSLANVVTVGDLLTAAGLDTDLAGARTAEEFVLCGDNLDGMPRAIPHTGGSDSSLADLEDLDRRMRELEPLEGESAEPGSSSHAQSEAVVACRGPYFTRDGGASGDCATAEVVLDSHKETRVPTGPVVTEYSRILEGRRRALQSLADARGPGWTDGPDGCHLPSGSRINGSSGLPCNCLFSLKFVEPGEEEGCSICGGSGHHSPNPHHERHAPQNRHPHFTTNTDNALRGDLFRRHVNGHTVYATNYPSRVYARF